MVVQNFIIIVFHVTKTVIDLKQKTSKIFCGLVILKKCEKF